MISSRPFFHLLKVTFEAQSAHAIHTGHGDTTHDSLIVRDANGLPTLVGTSLAGVLRHQYQKYFGEHKAKDLFGYAQGSEGQNSWLNVTWGLVHNSKNIAKEGLLSQAELQDPLLNKLLDQKPVVRQRVRLTDKGVTENTGKFDITLIPSGVRYTTFISYWCDGSTESKSQWQAFVNLLKENPLRIGKGTRNGYGLFEITALYQAEWNLTEQKGREGYSQRTRKRASHQGLHFINLDENQKCNVRASIQLQADSNWRIGGGEQYLANMTADRIPDLLPMHEMKVTWHNNQASFSQQFYLLPASAIKGALRHRIAFHYNCLTGCFVDDDLAYETDENPAIKQLFGFTQDQDSKAGILAFHDVYLTENPVHDQIVTHNKIDRYTGGVIRGALFSEVVLWRSRIAVMVDVINPNIFIDADIKQALTLALDDLANGWLPLGASTSRGLGVFKNTEQQVTWSDKQQWISAGEEV